MTRRRKDPLRPPTDEEREVLERISRAQTEPAVHVARAKSPLAVADGATYEAAARAAGRRSNDAVLQLVSRFNSCATKTRRFRRETRCFHVVIAHVQANSPAK
jgi:hypothetical protein